jgi:small subunit ribosomal protein S1
VEIEDGIDGLVHISDMSWAKRVRHPSEIIKKGDEVEVVVLEIDSDKKRISLGMKQTRENPWTELAKEFVIGTETTGTITRLLDRGAVVELRDDVEGFVPQSHLGIENIQKPSDHFNAGTEIPLKVIKMDPQNKRIVLSITAFLEDKGPEAVEEFKQRFPKKAEAVKDVTPETETPEGEAEEKSESATEKTPAVEGKTDVNEAETDTGELTDPASVEPPAHDAVGSDESSDDAAETKTEAVAGEEPASQEEETEDPHPSSDSEEKREG